MTTRPLRAAAETHRVTLKELREYPFPELCSPGTILFGGPIMLGRGVPRPATHDSWWAWREVDGSTVVRIERATPARPSS
jgi:hypothetical protein